MKVKELIELLSGQDPEVEVYSECPETSGSLTISGVMAAVNGGVIIEIDEYGPAESMSIKEFRRRRRTDPPQEK